MPYTELFSAAWIQCIELMARPTIVTPKTPLNVGESASLCAMVWIFRNVDWVSGSHIGFNLVVVG